MPRGRKKGMPAQYKYFDVTMICGIISMEPEVKTSTGGHNYANFTIGLKFKSHGKPFYKNFRAAAYDEIGNEILALAHKNDNVLVYGRVFPYIYHTKNGKSAAGMWINVIKWQKNPTQKDIKESYKSLEFIGFEDDDDEYGVDEGNEEILF